MKKQHGFRWLTAILAAVLTVSSLASLQPVAAKASSQKFKSGKIVLGSTGSDAQIWEHIAKTKQAKKLGLHIQVKELSDAVQLNRATQDGSLDVNAVQSYSYFADFNKKTTDGKLGIIGTTYLEPMGLYSDHFKSIKKVKRGATVALSQSPSQQARGLSLLAQAGLIKLPKDFTAFSTIKDVKANPRHLKFEPMDTTRGPQLLKDVDLVLMSNTEALQGGLNTKKALYHEKLNQKNYQNVNILVTQKKYRHNKTLKKLIKLYHEPAIKAWVKKKFKGTKVDVKMSTKKLIKKAGDGKTE